MQMKVCASVRHILIRLFEYGITIILIHDIIDFKNMELINGNNSGFLKVSMGIDHTVFPKTSSGINFKL